jgi:hypothetical protein
MIIITRGLGVNSTLDTTLGEPLSNKSIIILIKEIAVKRRIPIETNVPKIVV